MTIALAILFMALQIADYWTTKRFLAAGIPEFFAHIRWVIEHFGMAGLLAYKLAQGAIIVAIFWTIPLVLALACALYVGVVIWNYRQGST